MLHELVLAAARRTPDAIALCDAEGHLTYHELDQLANRVAGALAELGTRAGDRIAIWLPKSRVAVATMQAALRLGSAYVPLDPRLPPARAAAILAQCLPQAVVTTVERATSVALPRAPLPKFLCVDGRHAGPSWDEVLARPAQPVAASIGPDALAYILFTSGSTGTPKGVCLTHNNALAFIQWAVQLLDATPRDRFANHAGLHFDLSVLDLYAAFAAGAAVLLVPDDFASPKLWVDFIENQQPTIWYTTPSVLTLMMQYGGLCDLVEPSVRTLLFAGEAFPVTHLRRLMTAWPQVRFFNLYGPTETNVCTSYEVTELSPSRTDPPPIGRACCGDRVWAQRPDGTTAGPDEEGELLVAGPTVMHGYWGQPPLGDRPFPTGDHVRVLEDGSFQFLGRRDDMVKLRGVRIALGDVESALLTNSDIQQAAALILGTGLEARLAAVIVPRPSASLSLLDVKRHCAERLPPAMIVEAMRCVTQLPHTPTGKLDRKALGDLFVGDDR